MTTTMAQMKFRVLLFRDGEFWIAQALERDIAAQGKTLEDVQYQFDRAVMGRIAAAAEVGIDPFASLAAAPPMFFDAWRRGLPVQTTSPSPFALDTEHGVVSDLPHMETRVGDEPKAA